MSVIFARENMNLVSFMFYRIYDNIDKVIKNKMYIKMKEKD